MRKWKRLSIGTIDNDESGYVVTLKSGWRFSEDSLVPTHVRSFDSMDEAIMSMKHAIKCNCLDCSLVLCPNCGKGQTGKDPLCDKCYKEYLGTHYGSRS